MGMGDAVQNGQLQMTLFVKFSSERGGGGLAYCRPPQHPSSKSANDALASTWNQDMILQNNDTCTFKERLQATKRLCIYA